jgi:CRISPR system Cascade subunit CasC
MFVELHILQNFAPSCLNRDDTNAPKDCDFGGYRRARISSQCLKRSIRSNGTFSSLMDNELGIRTKLIPSQLAKRLIEAGKPENEAQSVSACMATAIWGELDANGKSKVLVFVSNVEIDEVVNTILTNWDQLPKTLQDLSTEKKAKKGKEKEKSSLQTACDGLAKKCSLNNLSPDIALFGRMVAERTTMNVSGACQVAHAISTNRVSVDMDFYTAVDDLQPKGETGAGMMGTIEFDSACFYRFSVVNYDELVSNLNGDTEFAKRTLDAYLRSAISAIPTGKQNSMAAHNPPSLVMTVVRDKGQPISLANAFVRPVTSQNGDLISESISRLDGYFGSIVKMYGKDGLAKVGVTLIGEQPTPGVESAGGKRFENLEQHLTSLKG